MGAYENPTYYGITQDYTAFNKAMIGTFDRYMAMYMQMQKSKTQESDPNVDYYKLLENLDEVPNLLNEQHVNLFGLNGSIRGYLPGASEDDKRKIQSLIIGMRGSYDNINSYFSNSELYKELDVETRNILEGIATGKTKILTKADQKNPWGNIYFENNNYGAISAVDLGKRLGLAERNFENENFGRQIINNSVSKVTNQIEIYQNRTKQSTIAGSNERNNIIKNYADNIKIGENWAGYWHNEMEDSDKIVDVTGEAKNAWLKVKGKYPGLSILDDNKIDLSMFGFSMIDFSDKDNQIMKTLRDEAIRKHIADELANQVAPDPYVAPNESLTQAQEKMSNRLDIQTSISDLANLYINQPTVGPVTNFNTGASGFLSYLKRNKVFKADNNFKNFQITDAVIANYLTGDEGLDKARQVIRANVAATYGGRQYSELSNKERAKVDDQVEQRTEMFKEAEKSNKVFNIDTGEPLDYRNFINDLASEIFNNNNFNEKLIDPRIPDEEGLTLPIFEN
tara:strand:+ start:357 stop:1886 length:1530 start_codon:yes stop_codon:yes gene_type:complete